MHGSFDDLQHLTCNNIEWQFVHMYVLMPVFEVST